jgi:hypothetical protein
MVMVGSVHVNFRPLDGEWDGQTWDPQEARCSNNFMNGPHPPVPPAGAANIVWEVIATDANSIVFDVSVDLAGSDEAIFTGLKNGITTAYLREFQPTDTGADGSKFYGRTRLEQVYKRGIYISNVFGASQDFTINVVGARPSIPGGDHITVNVR